MLCQKCGKQNPNDARICAYCGNPLGQYSVQQPPKKKKRGCLIAVIAAVSVLLLIIIIAVATSGDKDSSDETTAINAQAVVQETGKIGKYNVTVKDSVVVENDGKKILIVTYTFTNNSDESKAFDIVITDKLFQNGVELGPVYTSWGLEEHYNPDNKSKEIRPGVSLDLQKAYELNDPTTDVEVELSEWLSFHDEKAVYVIKIN